ncbi:MAG: alcohol dehydrogenase catalytic domain-containing protein [Halanaerobiaceae bacterium]
MKYKEAAIIKALTVTDGEVKVENIAKPEPADNEVLIKVKLAGICNTDFEVIAGMIDFNGVLGHEFVGEVVYDPEDKLAGKRVVGEINIPCYNCSRCENNQYKHCKNIKAIGMRGKDGALAEYLTLPRENIQVVPETVSDQEAVFTEPLAAAVEIAEQYHLKPSEKIMIIGDGKLGLIIARTLWAMGLNVEMIGRHQKKLDTLKPLNIKTYLEKLYPEKEPDIPVVIEATGSTSGLKAAIDLVAPEGKIIYKTTTAKNHDLNLAGLAINEIKLLGSRCGPFKPALNLMERNNLHLDKLITEEFKLDDALEALKRAREKSSLKILIRP